MRRTRLFLGASWKASQRKWPQAEISSRSLPSKSGILSFQSLLPFPCQILKNCTLGFFARFLLSGISFLGYSHATPGCLVVSCCFLTGIFCFTSWAVRCQEAEGGQRRGPLPRWACVSRPPSPGPRPRSPLPVSTWEHALPLSEANITFRIRVSTFKTELGKAGLERALKCGFIYSYCKILHAL